MWGVWGWGWWWEVAMTPHTSSLLFPGHKQREAKERQAPSHPLHSCTYLHMMTACMTDLSQHDVLSAITVPSQ